MQAAKRRKEYQRGEYQEPFRENLGEKLDIFIGGRKTEQNRRQKLQRECIDPFKWNEEIMNQYAAALEVRGVADETFDHLNVKYIIGEGESVIVGENGLVANASHIPAQSHIQDLPPDKLATTRDIFETIGELAVEMTGVQHDDWMLIAPTLAIPQYDDIFDMVQIHNRVESGLDYDRLSEEIVRVIEILEKRTRDNPDPTSAGKWLAESEIMPFAVEDTERQHLTKMTNYMMTLAQISRELRPLVRDGKISHVAGLIGASIVSDPSPHNELDDIYQQGEEIINRLSPSSINTERLTAIRRRKQDWDETADWYDTADRKR